MSRGNVRHMFPGGNTAQGFFSYYDNILPQEQATRIIIIKGGPGVGKSTFMKKIAEEMLERGFDLEFMHCSSDNNSLDGIVIPAIKVALMDGTAPHVVDPKNPGAIDEIIHLGDFWNETGLRDNKEYIMKDNREVGRLFARAYRYLKAAAAIYDDTRTIHSWALNTARVNEVAAELMDEVFEDRAVSNLEGRQRNLFASAISPGGLKNYLESLLITERVYVLKGKQGTGTEKVLGKLKEAAVERGLNIEAYYCTMNPTKIEHLVIPELNVSFTTDNKYHSAAIAAYKVIDFNEYLDRGILRGYAEALEYNEQEYDKLLNKAIDTIGKAKALHDHMEQYYIPNMDFEAIQRCWECTLSRILEYADM